MNDPIIRPFARCYKKLKGSRVSLVKIKRNEETEKEFINK